MPDSHCMEDVYHSGSILSSGIWVVDGSKMVAIWTMGKYHVQELGLASFDGFMCTGLRPGPIASSRPELREPSGSTQLQKS